MFSGRVLRGEFAEFLAPARTNRRLSGAGDSGTTPHLSIWLYFSSAWNDTKLGLCMSNLASG